MTSGLYSLKKIKEPLLKVAYNYMMGVVEHHFGQLYGGCGRTSFWSPAVLLAQFHEHSQLSAPKLKKKIKESLLKVAYNYMMVVVDHHFGQL